MQLKWFALLFVVALPSPASAQLCAVVLGTGGTLALSSDATILGSQQLGGIAGTVTITSIGANTINISAPARILSPASYNPGAEQVEVAYFGLGGLGVVNQGYTSSPTSFVVNTLPATILTLNNRIVNPNGFAAGTYTTQTVVTCN